jgi:hypothetical protein
MFKKGMIIYTDGKAAKKNKREVSIPPTKPETFEAPLSLLQNLVEIGIQYSYIQQVAQNSGGKEIPSILILGNLMEIMAIYSTIEAQVKELEDTYLNNRS